MVDATNGKLVHMDLPAMSQAAMTRGVSVPRAAMFPMPTVSPQAFAAQAAFDARYAQVIDRTRHVVADARAQMAQFPLRVFADCPCADSEATNGSDAAALPSAAARFSGVALMGLPYPPNASPADMMVVYALCGVGAILFALHQLRLENWGT